LTYAARPKQIRGNRLARVDHEGTVFELLSKITALASGWTSAALCLGAAVGYWGAGENKRALFWLALGLAEVLAIVVDL
jgi:hypothetical protein